MMNSLEIHVSCSGTDAATGRMGRPYLTIQRAVSALKDSMRPTKSAHIIVHGGTYYQSQPISISAGDLNNGQTSLTISAARNETVILKGSTRLEPHWVPYTGQVVKTELPAGTHFDQLFVNGNPQILARYPNYDGAARVYHGTASDAISPARVAKWSDPAGGYLHALHVAEWGCVDYRISGKDAKGELVLEGGWQNNRPMGMHREYRFVEGIKEELDSPGEWYLDQAQHTLYYWPMPGIDLKSSIYEGAVQKSLFEIHGSATHPVRGLTLKGLKLTQTARTFMLTQEPLLRSDWRIYRGGVVHLLGAENCRIIDCDILNVGSNALFIDGYCRQVTVSGCHIADAGASGICAVGNPNAVRNGLDNYDQRQSLRSISLERGPKGNEYPADCTVKDCLIERVGGIEKQSAGIEISMAFRIHVDHCTIHDVPRSGINIGDGCWGGHVIENCDVFDTVKETGDHGSFNSWGRDRYWGLEDVASSAPGYAQLPFLDAVEPVTLRRNRWRCDHGWDIDLDDGSSNYIIESNLCLAGGLKNREGYRRIVENNIIVNNSFHPHVWFAESGDIFRKNIVFEPYKPIEVPKPWGAQVDFNLLHQPGGHPSVKADRLHALSGRDLNSAAGDARFVAPELGDFRVQRGSPALRLGFRNFAMDKFGVTSARLKKIAPKPRFGAAPHGNTTDISPILHDWLGCTVRSVYGLGEMSVLGLPAEVGVLLAEVPPNSTASEYRLLRQDVILSLQGQPVASAEDFLSQWAKYKVGQKVNVTVWRSQRKIQRLFSVR